MKKLSKLVVPIMICAMIVSALVLSKYKEPFQYSDIYADVCYKGACGIQMAYHARKAAEAEKVEEKQNSKEEKLDKSSIEKLDEL